MKPALPVLSLVAILLSPVGSQAKPAHRHNSSVAASPAAAIAAAIAQPGRSEANRKLDGDRMPAAVLAFSGVHPGETVADFQAGGGYYTEMLASLVGPRGKVIALAAAEYFKPETWAPITAAHPNVSLVSVPITQLKLEPGSVNTIFTHLVFHDLYLGKTRTGAALPEPGDVLANWFAAVKPGGHVIIADHAGPAGDTTEIANRLHRIDPATAKAAMAKAGFVLQSESRVLQRGDDAHTLIVYDKTLRGHTDRFLLKFRRP